MKLNDHVKHIVDCDSWKKNKPPKRADIHWKEGRSAMELAKYVTNALPNMPREIEEVLGCFVNRDSVFDWDAEAVTDLPGSGEGRNHDAIFFNNDVVVCVEAKADESLGNLIGDELKGASINKLNRISCLLKMLFKDSFNQYADLRYQLLTASTGTILEAQNKGVNTAIFLVIIFSSKKNTTKAKLDNNDMDIQKFLTATNAVDYKNLKRIPNNTGIDLYFGKIVIDIDAN